VTGVGGALHALYSLDAITARPNRLTQFDPRARILATLTFIMTVVSFNRYTALALLPFFIFPVAQCAAGNIPLRWVARQVLIASPFAILVGVFNPLIDTASAVNLWGISVAGGWVSFTSILLRFALTVSAALVLVASTGLPALCASLEQLGLPRAFTVQLLLLHRYAMVLAGEANRMRMAHRLRAGDATLGLATYASLIGNLLLRSLERAQQIHRAMVARGFDGQLPGLRRTLWQARDTIFLGVCIVGCGVARCIDLPRTFGHALLGLLA
jgi:cobalt/nickel transport system permease protein